MKRRTLLTGKTGQVGSELLRLLPELGEVVAPNLHALDLFNPDAIRRSVRETRPELIINAAAFTAVDAAEMQEAEAHAINTDAPRVLSEEAKKLGAAVIHYSTDYVFDGSKTTPHDETDSPAPINVYGRTKLAGEQAVRATCVPHLIFRTAWVYSTRGRNFLCTILRLATEGEELRVLRDQFGSPTWSRDIALTTVKILAQRMSHDSSAPNALAPVSGTYHLTAAGETTWYGAPAIPSFRIPALIKHSVSNHPTGARNYVSFLDSNAVRNFGCLPLECRGREMTLRVASSTVFQSCV